MSMRAILLATTLTLVGGWSVRAEPLACTQYRDRLNAAVAASEAGATDTVGFTLGFSSPTRGKRYDWALGSLAGSLSCGQADEFEEFGIRLQFTDKQTLTGKVKDLVKLQGAAICALASDGAAACTDFGKAMLQQAFAQMGRAYTKGSRAPSGLSDQTLSPGNQAEVVSTPSLIIFTVGPGRGASIDAERHPLPMLPALPQ